jgi:hypothetical protein
VSEAQRASGKRRRGISLDEPPRLSVGPADVPGFPAGAAFPRRVRRRRALLTTLAFAATLASVLPFYFGFWFALEFGRLLSGAPYPFSSVVASFPAGLAALGLFYLATDRLGTLGDDEARHLLTDKAARVFAPAPLPDTRFYVEARTENGRFRLREDRGVLVLLPDRLVFVGDRQVATFPRRSFTGKQDGRPRLDPFAPEGMWVRYARQAMRLGPAWRTLEMEYPWGSLRLLARDTAARLSETHRDARRLERALREWLDYSSTQPSDAADR